MRKYYSVTIEICHYYYSSWRKLWRKKRNAAAFYSSIFPEIRNEKLPGISSKQCSNIYEMERRMKWLENVYRGENAVEALKLSHYRLYETMIPVQWRAILTAVSIQWRRMGEIQRLAQMAVLLCLLLWYSALWPWWWEKYLYRDANVCVKPTRWRLCWL